MPKMWTVIVKETRTRKYYVRANTELEAQENYLLEGLTSDLYDYGDTAQYTLTTPTVDGLTGTTSFGAEGTSVGLTKAGDAFLGGKYNFSINADDDNNVNAALTAGWKW